MKTVKNALAILDSFTSEVPIQGVTEIARKLGLHKSSAFSLLSTLREEGYVIHHPDTRRYSLGFKPLDLAGRIQHQRDLGKLSLPVLKELSRKIGEDVALNILIEGKRVCIALQESRYFVRQFVPLGKALPLHCSAAGKVLLAYLPLEEVEGIIRRHGLPRFTPNTITEKKRLAAALDNIKRKGYGESREEYGRDAAAVAFPIFNGKGKIVASLSIQSTVNRLNRKARPLFIREGGRAAQEIGSLLAENWERGKD